MKAHFSALLTVVLLSGMALAQEQEGKDSILPGNKVKQDLLLRWISLDQNNFYLSNEFVAADGNYAAQDAEELQTYYDLGLKYQYIEQDEYRTQMQLPKGEGIMIKSAPPKSNGYRFGFRDGDIVLKVADKPVDDQYKFVIGIKESRGADATVKLRRAGIEKSFKFTMPKLEPELAKDSWLLGVHVGPINHTLKKHLRTDGLLIQGIVEKSPAEKMGLQVDDVIVAIDQQPIKILADLQNSLKKSKGAKVTVQLIREGHKVTVEIIPMKKEPKTTQASEIPYLKWQFGALTNDFTIYSKYDVDEDGKEDFFVMPEKKSDPVADSLLKRFDELSKKIDELTKQVDQLRSKK